MDLRVILASAAASPSFDEEWDSLAHTLACLDAGDSHAFYDMARDFFAQGITNEKIEHAVREILPLQIDRRLEMSAELLSAYADARSVMNAQKSFMTQSPVLRGIASIADAIGQIHSAYGEFDHLAMHEYNKADRHARDLTEFGFPVSKATREKLFRARLSDRLCDHEPESLLTNLPGIRARMQTHHDNVRELDLQVAQFKLTAIGASFLLNPSELKRGELNAQYAYARDLISSIAASHTPGHAALDTAQNVMQIVLPVLRAQNAPRLKS